MIIVGGAELTIVLSNNRVHLVFECIHASRDLFLHLLKALLFSHMGHLLSSFPRLFRHLT